MSNLGWQASFFPNPDRLTNAVYNSITFVTYVRDVQSSQFSGNFS